MTGRKLRALGFSSAGGFLAADEEGGRIKFHQRELLPRTGGLYALVLNDLVVYVGAHGRPLSMARKLSYAAAQLRLALKAGDRVRVMIATPEPRSWNGIPVDTALGLEPALIERAQPPWNVLGNEGEEALQIWREAALKAHGTRQKRLRAAGLSQSARKAA
jgi:hypothetical protein